MYKYISYNKVIISIDMYSPAIDIIVYKTYLVKN